MAIAVMATRTGFYGGQRMNPGDKFFLRDKFWINPKTKRREIKVLQKTVKVHRNDRGIIIGRDTTDFPLTAENQFSHNWMEKIDPSEVPADQLNALAMAGDTLEDPKAVKKKDARGGDKAALSEL